MKLAVKGGFPTAVQGAIDEGVQRAVQATFLAGFTPPSMQASRQGKDSSFQASISVLLEAVKTACFEASFQERFQVAVSVLSKAVKQAGFQAPLSVVRQLSRLPGTRLRCGIGSHRGRRRGLKVRVPEVE